MKKYNKQEIADEKFFTERGFGQEIGFGSKPAILVVDMMNAFTDKNSPLGFQQDKQIEIINNVLSASRLKKIPIFFTIVAYEEDNLSDAGYWYHKQKGLSDLRANTEKVKIDSRIKRNLNEPIIVKKFASAFFGTDLISRLNYLRIDTIIFVGCSTSGCIRASAVDAIQLGLRPIIIEDAVSDRSKNAHMQSLFDLKAKYADVLKSNIIINILNKNK